MALVAELSNRWSAIDPHEFANLGMDLGAVGSFGRIQQISDDPRWALRIVSVTENGRLVAAVPIFLGRGDRWTDQLHSPEAWGGPPPPPLDECAFIGGRQDVRAGVHCVNRPDVIEAARDMCAEMPELIGRQLHFSYYDTAQRHLAEQIFGSITWQAQFDEYAFPAAVIHGAPADLPKRTRQLLRQDQRRIAEAGISVETSSWSDHDGHAAELIARQNRHKGLEDHAELVEYRMELWDECEDVSVHVACDQDGLAAVTMLVHRDELEVYEIGLPQPDTAYRLELYLALGYHAPLTLARAKGLTRIRMGMESGQAKTHRGAVAIPRFCGFATPFPR
ncbi:hypothetical protein ABZS29_17545 [Kribbella sp. NPDC005582]|uniref:hypothetical protein n=1 Tax=Kribbella sp. NPDC005582 TaxID=3156893 RepID=UPI0033A45589